MKRPRFRTPTSVRLLGLLPVMAAIAASDGAPAPHLGPEQADFVEKHLSRRPLRFAIRRSTDGLDFLRIEAAGDSATLATSQVYRTDDGAKHAADVIIESVLSGNFEIVDCRDHDAERFGS